LSTAIGDDRLASTQAWREKQKWSAAVPEIEATLQRDYSSEQSAAPLANSGRSRCQTAKR
jgi:hypothetical protein